METENTKVVDSKELVQSIVAQTLSAVPIISIQRPSRETSEAGPSEDHGVDGRGEAESGQPVKSQGDSSALSVKNGGDEGPHLNGVSPRPTQHEPENSEPPHAANPKGTFLPKVRNVVIRKTYLKITLGRRLASPIKEALRQQAKGLDATIAEIQVVE